METEKPEVEVSQPETTQTEVPNAEDLATLKAELEKTKQMLVEKEKQAKANQTIANKKTDEARKWQSEITGINARLDAVVEALDAFSTQPADEEERPKKVSIKEKVAEKLKTIPQVDPNLEHAREVAAEIMELQKKSGIDFEKIEDDRVITYFNAGKVDKAKQLAEEIVNKMETEKKAKADEENPEKKKVAELEAELARLKKVASGALDTEKGLPVGGSLDFRAMEQKYIKGEISRDDYEKARLKRGY